MELSIIIPVYNSEKYLDRTIKNVLSQRFKKFELILVDDGSGDNSGNICDSWSRIDKRINVIHQSNSGIGGARNVGLEAANGKYIGLVDNDDIIHPQMFEILICVAKKNNADIVMSFAEQIYENTEIKFEERDIDKINSEEIECDLRYRNLYNSSPDDSPYRAVWNKIYRKNAIKLIRFPEQGAEDAVFNNRIYGQVDKFIIIDNSIHLYYWIQRASSQYHNLSSGYQIKMLWSQFQMLEELEKNFPEFSHYCVVKTMKMVLSYRYIFRHTKYYNTVNECIDLYKKKLKKLLIHNKDISVFIKCLLMIFYYFPFTYNLFRRVNDKK